MALNMKAIQSKREDLEKSGGGNLAGWDKLKKGKNVRRILPPKGDNDIFWAEGFVHFGLGSDGKTTATCLETFDEKCPICEYVEELKKSKNKEDKKYADRIKKTKRTYISVINRDSEDDEEKPLVLSVGKTILQPILDLICDPDYGDITDFDDGLDITITKSGEGLNTEYSVQPKRQSSPAATTITEEELQEQLPDLDALFVRKSAEELEALMNGEEYDDSGEDDKDLDGQFDDLDIDELKELCEEYGIKIPKKANKLALINLLEEAEAAAEEDEEPKKPVKKTSSKKQVQEDDEDEESGDDEEDDGEDDEEPEEPAPKKTSSKASKGNGKDTMDAITAALARRKANKK
jgi:hypothetical protein